MATFQNEDVDISPDEYVSACSKHEIEELVEILHEDGHIHYGVPTNQGNVNDILFWKNINVLRDARLRMSKEDEDLIHELAKKYRL